MNSTDETVYSLIIPSKKHKKNHTIQYVINRDGNFKFLLTNTQYDALSTKGKLYGKTIEELTHLASEHFSIQKTVAIPHESVIYAPPPAWDGQIDDTQNFDSNVTNTRNQPRPVVNEASNEIIPIYTNSSVQPENSVENPNEDQFDHHQDSMAHLKDDENIPQPSPVVEHLFKSKSVARYNLFKNTGMTIGAIVVPAVSVTLLAAPMMAMAPSLAALVGAIAAVVLLSALVGMISGSLVGIIAEKCTRSNKTSDENKGFNI